MKGIEIIIDKRTGKVKKKEINSSEEIIEMLKEAAMKMEKQKLSKEDQEAVDRLNEAQRKVQKWVEKLEELDFPNEKKYLEIVEQMQLKAVDLYKEAYSKIKEIMEDEEDEED